MHPAPLGQCGLSRSTDGQARWRVTDRAIWALTGQQQSKVKMVKPPTKVQIPQGEEQEEEQEEEEPHTGGRWQGGGGGPGLAVLLTVSCVSFPPGQRQHRPLLHLP